MKKIAAFFLSLMLLLTISYGQTLSKQNVVAYNNQEECKSGILLQELMDNDTSYAQKIANYNKLVQQGNILNKGTVYNIPVVVHVIHLGEPEGTGTNISDAQIHSAINNLNQAFRNQAPYTGVDMEINFCLASVDPSGNPTSGINRVNGSGTSDYATQGITNDGGSSMNEIAVKALSNWGNTNYYQFWIVAGIDGNMGGGGTQGYAYFIQDASKDGAVILYNSFGYDPTGTLCYNLKSYTNQNVTTTHEVGHAFGLYHTFEGDGSGSTCPTNNNCSTDGDKVCDTPPHKRSVSDCVVATNTCTGGSSSDHIHNFMDYSSDDCQTEFTANQVTRARAWLLSSRASLTTSTKCNPVAVPVSNFEAVCGSQSGCAGSSINFFDLSEGNPTSWSWSFPGGSPATSNIQHPTISYATPGTYAVTLTATNDFGTGNAETKTGFITIYSSPAVACSTGSQNAGNFWQTLYNVTFNEINNSTSQYVNTAYTDFSCFQTTVVNAGDSYQMSISVNAEGGSGNEVFEAYIDYNNNGSFADAGEMVFSGSVASGNLGTFNQNIAIPLTATTNTLLRMRVIGETNSISVNERNCAANYFVGDVEDYGVYILAAGTPPVAAFSAASTTLCNGSSTVFTDASTNTPTSWSWSFTPSTVTYISSSSTSQNPNVRFDAPGTYQVKLTATNASGSDDEIKVGYITVNAAPSISSQPANSVITEGNNTSFSVIASNATGYQWQVNTGSGFGNIINGGVYSNATTATLNITGATLVMNGYTYRCIASGNCTPTATSNSGSLTVDAAPVIPTTQIRPNHCGITMSQVNQQVYAIAIPNATQYEFKLVPQGGGATLNYLSCCTFRLNFAWFTGWNYNTTYDVSVRVKVDGLWSEYGVSCPITTTSIPLPTIQDNHCGITMSQVNQQVYAKAIPNATQYEFMLISQDSGDTLNYLSCCTFRLNFAWFTGWNYNTTYDVSVRANVGGTWTAYGVSCPITSPSSQALYADNFNERLISEEDFQEEVTTIGTTLSIYPNPNSGEQLNVNLEYLSPNSTLTITDIYGKVILTKQLNTDQSEYKVNVKFENKLSEGFYLVSISSEGNTITEKLIVR